MMDHQLTGDTVMKRTTFCLFSVAVIVVTGLSSPVAFVQDPSQSPESQHGSSKADDAAPQPEVILDGKRHTRMNGSWP